MFLVWEMLKRWPILPKDHIEPISDNPSVVCVKMGLRRISWLCLGVNHWSVLLGLSNGQWVCVQSHNNGAITAHVCNEEHGAALYTTPLSNRKLVRTSIYGSTNRLIHWSEIETWIRSRQGGYYLPGVRDCQNFSRQMIGWLTNRWVGVWPIEDGHVFSPGQRATLYKMEQTTFNFHRRDFFSTKQRD